MKKYQYMQIGIASPEEIITWANPVLEGKQFTYDPKHKDKVTYIDEQGNKVDYELKGEVKKPETVNYRTQKPEKDGLFCEVIFGPTKDYQCACGKSSGHRQIGVHKVCERCGVELTESKVRRERMGYIALASPVVHTWYLRNTPSKIATLLDLKTRQVEEIVYCAAYVVTDIYNEEIANDEFHVGSIITAQEYYAEQVHHRGEFEAHTGAETIKYLLQKLDLPALVVELREKLKNATKQKKESLVKRLEIAEAFTHSTNKPEWMVMDVIPVIPPDLRPMVQLEGGRFATTDLNELYRRILNRNIRLRRWYEQNAASVIILNEMRLLQEAVDALIDNSKRNKKVAQANNRPLKSLSVILRGKQGRFRQNLLGKRVDYSGRSVICVGPFLKMYQCGIPREMALILFKPFIINYLCTHQLANQTVETQDANGNTITVPATEKASIRKAKEMIERGTPEAMDALEHVVVEHPVLLNRAPTLHRLSIQAFEPVLVQGRAIRLHPLATTAFNADFDGDQMPVHVPLSVEAQTEARLLMLASKNILAPKDGKPVVTPSQDMIIGNYYLTIERHQGERKYTTFEELYKAYTNRLIENDEEIYVEGDELSPYRNIEELRKYVESGKKPAVAKFTVLAREGKAFRDIAEVEHAYEEHQIDFHTRFVMPAKSIGKPFVHLDPEDPDYEEKVKLNEELMNKYIVTTYGKLIFNQVFPDKFVYFNDPDTQKGDGMYNLKVGTPLKFFLDRGTNFKEAIAAMPLGQPAKKKTLSAIISEVFRQCKLAETSLTLDKMKDLGFYYSTISGLTISAFDVVTLQRKYDIIHESENTVNKYNKMYKFGLMSNKERRDLVVKTWANSKEDIKKEIEKVMKDNASTNDIFMMADSGARGSSDNFTQLAGMRGLMAKPNGESMEIPVKTCFSEGMSMADFFNSTHGARKGSTDTALKTAESGYLTRRLVDVSQDITITMEDCGTERGLVMTTLYKKRTTDPDFNKDTDVLVKLKERVAGRFAAKTVAIKNKEGKKEVIVEKGQFITMEIAERIGQLEKEGKVTEVEVRTNLTCDCPNGVCVKCYGSDLSTNGIVETGEVVGIVAAQSIGEPGTQLTMRTFHSGGVAGGSEDITQGLPRVQELFEARPPKGQGIISEIKGKVTKVNVDKNNSSRYEIHIESPIEGNDKVYVTDAGRKPCVKEGDEVMPGDVICDGALNVKDLLRVSSVDKVEKYILKEIQYAYRTAAGVEISDKHVEIIVKQMLQKVVVIDSGETDLLLGELVSKSELYEIVSDCVKNGKRCPVVKPVVLGITRASLKSDSFLAAASFQETTRVLTEAAIRGKIDKLEGLKENIIIGGLIPAGTGLVDRVKLTMPEEEPSYDVKKLDL